VVLAFVGEFVDGTLDTRTGRGSVKPCHTAGRISRQPRRSGRQPTGVPGGQGLKRSLGETPDVIRRRNPGIAPFSLARGFHGKSLWRCVVHEERCSDLR
jgi:hypothetical protein